MYKLRDYQVDLSKKALKILNSFKMVYFSVQVRCGKTLMALETAKLYGAKKVLFITKKKAISSIQSDYNNFGYTYDLNIINKESIHKITNNNFDLIICDEAHGLFGSFPKPNNFSKVFKKRFSNLPMIFLSGTPTPESFSQIYHQFWVSKYSPFTETSFYKWAKNYVNVKQRNLGYATVNDYSDANYDLIKPVIVPYMIKFTQKEAGFSSKVNEHFLNVKMKPLTYKLTEQLKKDLVVEGKEQNIVADTAVKLMQKLHQMYSGTIKFDDGSRMCFDLSKAEFIKQYFKGKKIGIYYKFIAELDALQQVFGDDLTTDLHEFNNTNKNIALQFISGREGISLKKADCLVAYNIDFSATTYFQFKERLATKERTENNLYWVFSDKGIERRIYNAVSKKKNFTKSIFNKEYNLKLK